MRQLYEASLRERIEYYIECIGNEIHENERMIKKYEETGNNNVEVLKFFKDRLTKIQNDFQVALKILEQI